MLSVIIPAHNEDKYLNRTIQNIFDTCDTPPEVIVIDQGGNGTIDQRAITVTPDENVGERVAMNMAAKRATGDFLFRIDAHCDFSPQGWDTLMMASTGEKDITVAVLTATSKEWERVKGHWYGFAKIIVNEHNGIECKWQKANRDHMDYSPVEPNMGLTGCGFMIRTQFYWEIGGADESLPKMGAIGEEFAVKAWIHGGKVQTRTDVMVGHIFGTGGYATFGVKRAQQMLYEKYGEHMESIWNKFPEEWRQRKVIKVDQPGEPIHTITIDKQTTEETTDDKTGKLLRKKITDYRYIWYENEHPEDKGMSEDEIREKYCDKAIQIGQKIIYIANDGTEIPVEM